MKKYLLVLSLLSSFAFIQKTNAQCSVGNQTVVIKSFNSSNPSNCTITFDLILDLENNAGNKYVFLHAFNQAQYPSYFQTAAPGLCNSTSQGVINPPRRGTFAQGNLQNAAFNVGFNNDFGTAGYLSYIASPNYLPDPGTPMISGSGLVEKVVGAPAGYQRFILRNLSFSTGLPCSATVSLLVDSWSSNAASLNKAQCWKCASTYIFNNPIVNGLVNCTNPRSFNLILETTLGSVLEGTYDVYFDNAPFNSFGPEDQVGTPVATGTYSGLSSSNPVIKLNQTYTGNTDPALSKLSLWIQVKVTTPGIQINNVAKLLSNTCLTLPVSLKNFEATKRTGKVSLTWQTELEVNNDGFEIQRKVGNGKYETIAFVDSKAPGGNGNDYNYNFDDLGNPKDGVTYYRLRQVDLDGNAKFSDIRSIRSNSKVLTVSVYPNPSRGTVNVALPEGVGIVDVVLEDFTGKQVQRWNSTNFRNLQLNNLKPGIYILRINAHGSGEQAVERILIQ